MITTNFTTTKSLVLVSNDEDNKVIAIIQVEAGKQNIGSRVAEAVKDDRSAESAKIVDYRYDDLQDYFGEGISFNVETQEDGEDYSGEYTLISAVVY